MRYVTERNAPSTCPTAPAFWVMNSEYREAHFVGSLTTTFVCAAACLSDSIMEVVGRKVRWWIEGGSRTRTRHHARERDRGMTRGADQSISRLIIDGIQKDGCNLSFLSILQGRKKSDFNTIPNPHTHHHIRQNARAKNSVESQSRAQAQPSQ